MEDHYQTIAPHYDRIFLSFSRARANFIKRILPLARDDQLIDIGGGTAQVSLMIKEDMQLTKPVVCVDPSKEMLEMARKNGAITVQSTAESFLERKPEYLLKKVLFIGCIHHFKDPGFVFECLAKHLPSDGICLIVGLGEAGKALPIFKAAQSSFNGLKFQSSCSLIEQKGLKYKMHVGTERMQCEKTLWYEGIRRRFLSSMSNFTDEQLEEGIKELEEEQFKHKTVLDFEITVTGIVVTTS